MSKKENWKTEKLGDVSDIVGGATPDTDRDEYWGGDINWLIPSEITGENQVKVEDTERKITEEGFENSSTHILPEDSVLMTSRATVGVPVINKKPISTNQGFQSFKLIDYNTNPHFLYYWISDNSDFIDSLASGATFGEITKSELSKLKISIPTPEEQERIASVLYSVDELIGELRGKRDNLQETKQALMQDLLTGEKRVTPEMEVEEKILYNRKIPSKVSGDEWNKKRISDILKELETGNRPEGGGLDEGFAISLGGGEIDSDGFVDYSDVDYVGKEFYEDLDLKVKEGDVLMTKDGEKSGETALVRTEGDNVTVNGHVYIIRTNEYFNQAFLHYYLSSKEGREQLYALATGSAQDGINKEFKRLVKIPVPPLWEQERIASVLYTVDEMISNVDDKIECLEEAKQGLMQDLLTGDKRTPETLEILEEILDDENEK